MTYDWEVCIYDFLHAFSFSMDTFLSGILWARGEGTISDSRQIDG